jgi:hypothetical protein
MKGSSVKDCDFFLISCFLLETVIVLFVNLCNVCIYTILHAANHYGHLNEYRGNIQFLLINIKIFRNLTPYTLVGWFIVNILYRQRPSILP